MAFIDQLVNLVINLKNKAVSLPGYGTPLILAHHEIHPERRVLEYTEASEMLDDGWDEDDAAYQMALIIKSQKPAPPETFKIGRRSVAYEVSLDPDTNITETYVSTSFSEATQDATVTLDDTNTKIGQLFLDIAGGPLRQIKLYLKKASSPTGNATVKIYATSGGVPTGVALATSDTFDVSTLTTSLALVTFTFTGAERIDLTAGTTYALSLEYASGDGTNKVHVGVDSSSPSYAGGTLATYAGSWSAVSGSDAAFYIYKQRKLSVVLDGKTITHLVTNAENGDKALVCAGLVTDAESALGVNYTVDTDDDVVTVRAPDGAIMTTASALGLTVAQDTVDTPQQTIRLIPVRLSSGTVYEGSVGGTDYSYTVDPSDAGVLADVCGAWATQLATDLAGVDCTISATSTYVQVVTDTAGDILAHDHPKDRVHIKDATPDDGLATDLAAVRAEDDDWYAMYTVFNGEDTILAGAAAIEAIRKIYITQSADWDIKDNGEDGDIASQLKTLGYTRTFGIWHSKIGGVEWLAAGWSAAELAQDPATSTWAHKSVTGVSIDEYSGGEISAFENKNWSFYVEVGGNGNTFEGKSGSGEFADLVRDIDFMHSTLQGDIVFVLQNNRKTPFTKKGIERFRSTLENRLVSWTKPPRQILSDDAEDAPVVTFPEPKDIDASDRIRRLLPGGRGGARAAGAIHRLSFQFDLAV